MKVLDSKARQERRERRVRIREEVAAEIIRHSEELGREYEKRRQEWLAGPRILKIWSRGWLKPYEMQFSKTRIPWNPGPDGQYHPIDLETARKALQAEAENDAREAALQNLADQVLADKNLIQHQLKSGMN
jgi:hypothetical protein